MTVASPRNPTKPTESAARPAAAASIAPAFPTTVLLADWKRVVASVYRWLSAQGIVRPNSGGRSWWAHLEFICVNIKPTTSRKKIEE
jgi:hypothetical protein